MSGAMKAELVKDLEESIEIMKKFPEKTYTFLWDHDWINDLLGWEFIDFSSMLLPDTTLKDLYPILERILESIKDTDPNDDRIGNIYISPDWCSIQSFLHVDYWSK